MGSASLHASGVVPWMLFSLQGHSVRRNTHVIRTMSSSVTQFDKTEELPIVIPTSGVPIHLYTHEVERQALDQLKYLAESPLPKDYVSAMPDCHLGKGVTIGTVFASESYVCPNAVGVDIGCGMAAIPIDGLFKRDLEKGDLIRMQQMIKERIPTGFNQHRKKLSGTKEVIDIITAEAEPTEYLKEQLTLPRVTDQLGTLGGGNHFLEVSVSVSVGRAGLYLKH